MNQQAATPPTTRNSIAWCCALAVLACAGGCGWTPIKYVTANAFPVVCKDCPGGLPGPGGCRSFIDPWCAGYQNTMWRDLGTDCGPSRIKRKPTLAPTEEAAGGDERPKDADEAPLPPPDFTPERPKEPDEVPLIPEEPDPFPKLRPEGEKPAEKAKETPPDEIPDLFPPADDRKKPDSLPAPPEELFPESEKPKAKPPESKTPAKTPEKEPEEEAPPLFPDEPSESPAEEKEPAGKKPSAKKPSAKKPEPKKEPLTPDELPSVEDLPDLFPEEPKPKAKEEPKKTPKKEAPKMEGEDEPEESLPPLFPDEENKPADKTSSAVRGGRTGVVAQPVHRDDRSRAAREAPADAAPADRDPRGLEGEEVPAPSPDVTSADREPAHLLIASQGVAVPIAQPIEPRPGYASPTHALRFGAVREAAPPVGSLRMQPLAAGSQPRLFPVPSADSVR